MLVEDYIRKLIGSRHSQQQKQHTRSPQHAAQFPRTVHSVVGKAHLQPPSSRMHHRHFFGASCKPKDENEGNKYEPAHEHHTYRAGKVLLRLRFRNAVLASEGKMSTDTRMFNTKIPPLLQPVFQI